MTNQELTLDQLQSVVGGIVHPQYKRNTRRVATKGFDIGPVTTRGIRGDDQALMRREQEMKAVEIGVPPEPKLWFQLLG